MIDAQTKSRVLSTLALLLTTLAATSLLLIRGPSCGHDFDFHLVSWLEAARSWHSGILLPHWVQSANFGAGEPRFVFYPPASWILGAALGSLFGWTHAPFLFTALCLFCAGLTMRRFAARWLVPAGATAAACLYIANPYMLLVAYERTAYAELMAAALIPLLLAFALKPLPPVAALGAVVAGMWLMNAPAAVIACYTLLWLALMRCVSERSLRAPLRVAAATLLALALAAVYLVPAARQERWVEIARVTAPGMRFADGFLFHRTGEPYHDAVLHTASLLACVLLGVATAGFALWRDRRRPPLLWLATFVPLVLLLLIPASTLLWRHAPQLAYVQFPWRWLIMLAPVAALSCAGAAAQCGRHLGFVTATVLLTAGSILVYTRAFHQYCDDEDAVAPQLALMQAGDGQEGTDEYTPRDDDNAEIAQDMPRVRVLVSSGAEEPDSSRQENPAWKRDSVAELAARIAVQQWSPEDRVVMLDSPASGFAVLRLMDYPAWTVVRNGTPVATRPRRDDGLLTIPVPQGQSRIEVRWHTTPDIWAGRIISLLALAVFLPLWRRERKSR